MNTDAKPTGARFICNAVASTSEGIFFTNEYEGCSSKNDGLWLENQCNEHITDQVFVDGNKVVSGYNKDIDFFCSQSDDIEKREAYLQQCISEQGCPERLDFHAIGRGDTFLSFSFCFFYLF